VFCFSSQKGNFSRAAQAPLAARLLAILPLALAQFLLQALFQEFALEFVLAQEFAPSLEFALVLVRLNWVIWGQSLAVFLSILYSHLY
jgi:predicted benzoate:H+ symporter BenE